MKKITFLLFFLSISSLVLGQVVISENFDSGTPAGWTDSYSNSSTQSCSGSSERDNLYSSSTTGNLTSPNFASGSNGTDLEVSFDYKVVDWSAATNPTAAGWGTAELQYSTDDGTNWTTALLINDGNHVTSASCATMMTTIPGASLPNGSDVKLRIFNTWASGDYYFYVDNFVAAQTITNPPNCDASLTTPTNGATGVSEETNLTWSAATGGAEGYKVSVGTSMGGTDIANNVDVGPSLTYDLPLLAYSQQYYVTIVSYNSFGDGTGCSEESFTTRAAPPVGEACGNPISIAVEADCSVATPSTVDFATAADLGPVGSCDTVGVNTGAWFDFTTTSAPGVTISSTDTGAEYAIFDSCGGTELACGNFSEGSTTWILSASTNYKLAVWKDGATTGTTDICIQEFTPPPAPNCVETPISPSDGQSDVSLYSGTLTISWTAPSSGPTPTEYDFYFGTTSGSLSLLGTITETSVDLVNLDYASTYYWQVVPINDIVEATGCAEYSFSTEAAPAPPANDDCSGATPLIPGGAYNDNPVDGTVVSATTDAEDVDTCGEPGPGVWYSVVVPGDGNITIETGPDSVSGITTFDSVIEVFSGTCGSLTSIDCDDDGATTANFSLIELTGRTPGETLYIRVWEYLGDENEPFSISAFNATLSNDEFSQSQFSYYPNPTRDILHFNSAETIDGISVYNLLGQEVLKINPRSVNPEVNISSLKSGNYFAKVTIGNRTETIKIIKE